MTDNLYILKRNLLYKELHPIWEALSSINYAVVKGEALSQQIYGEPGRRRSSDIDILIDKKNVRLLENELQKVGFEQRLPEDKRDLRKCRVLCLTYSHQIPFYHKEKFGFRLDVDVNHDIFWGQYEGSKYSIEDFLSDVVEMNIYDSKVKVLPLDKAFVHLVLHHYKEMNSLYHLCHYNYIRTYMFKDIYDILRLKKDILTIEKVQKLGKEYDINSIIYYMLYYTNCVFPGTFIEKYLFVLKDECSDMLIESYGLCTSERKKWKLPFEARLNNDTLCSLISEEMNELDLKNLKLNNLIFD